MFPVVLIAMNFANFFRVISSFSDTRLLGFVTLSFVKATSRRRKSATLTAVWNVAP